VDRAAANNCELVDSAEYGVGGSVPTMAFPPALGDSLIVTVDLEMCAWCFGCGEHSKEEFETNCLCPTNVTVV
jgi:hypothetical protein